MIIEIEKSNGNRILINTEKVLLCSEIRGSVRIELEDGTPIDTAYTLDELLAVFHNSGEAFATSEQRKSKSSEKVEKVERQ